MAYIFKGCFCLKKLITKIEELEYFASSKFYNLQIWCWLHKISEKCHRKMGSAVIRFNFIFLL